MERKVQRKVTPLCGSVALILYGTLAVGTASASALSRAEFDRLALRCGPEVAASTLASIAEVETKFQPLAINDNTTGRAGIPANPELAISIASSLLKAGDSLDLGIMQINSANFDRLGMSLEQAFDPCLSIGAASKILSADYAGGDTREAQQSALRSAISRYNTGDPRRGFDNGYVRKVVLAARQIVPSIDTAAPNPTVATGALSPAPKIVDKNAPPSWDVWGSYEYDETLGKADQADSVIVNSR